MMKTPTGFAINDDGSFYVCVEGSEIIAHDGNDDAPIWLTRLVGDVLGVAIVEDKIWALQEDEIVMLAANGTRDDRFSVPAELIGIIAQENCVVVYSATSVFQISYDYDIGGYDINDLAIADAAVVSIAGPGIVTASDSSIHFYDEDDLGSSLTFDAAVVGISCSAEVYAIVTTKGLHRWATPWNDPVALCSFGEETDVTEDVQKVAIHMSGMYAAIARTSRVDVYDLGDGNCVANIVYPDRQVNGVGWTGSGLLGIGLVGGDANLVDLDNHVLRRSDTHPERTHRSWLVELGIDLPDGAEVADEEVVNGKSLDAFHAALADTEDIDKRARMLRNASVPDEISDLIDAGLRCIPLLSDPAIDDEPAKSAHARLDLIMTRLRLKEPTLEVLHAIEEMEKAIAKQETQASKDLWLGCLLLLGIAASVVGLLWWVFS